MISLHNIAHIRATQSQMPGGNWAELHFISGVGETASITLYFDNPSKVQPFADAINSLFIDPQVIHNISLEPKEPVE
jgi:hypothetical protein